MTSKEKLAKRLFHSKLTVIDRAISTLKADARNRAAKAEDEYNEILTVLACNKKGLNKSLDTLKNSGPKLFSRYECPSAEYAVQQMIQLRYDIEAADHEMQALRKIEKDLYMETTGRTKEL